MSTYTSGALAVTLALASACCGSPQASQEPWPSEYTPLLADAGRIRTTAEYLLTSESWQVAEVLILGVEEVSEAGGVDSAAASKAWLTVKIVLDASSAGQLVLLPVGEVRRVLHDPHRTFRDHQVASPVGVPIVVGQRRTCVLLHVVEAGLFWRQTRAVVVGPIVQ